jgi:hypothetical protein
VLQEPERLDNHVEPNAAECFMSITLNELLVSRDGLRDQSGEEAAALGATIARREAELRARIADLIATVSAQENWKLLRCAAVARRVEQTPANRLESICEYLLARKNGQLYFEVPASLADCLSDGEARAEPMPAPSAEPIVVPTSDREHVWTTGSIVELYGRMGTLESLVTPTPGMGCGVQGVRIMRIIALMSKARSARLAKMRISGTQAVYRHT